MRSTIVKLTKHVKCVGGLYPRSEIERGKVPEEFISWNLPFRDYNPKEYTAPFVLKAEWADPQIGSSGFSPKFNTVDGKVDRVSFYGEYEVIDGRPRNPVGRTGITGRGVLGKWGPNHAADPIVTRWKRDSTGSVLVNKESKSPILEAVLITRKDCGEWAIPGGMVDPGEVVTSTLKREFLEEAMDQLQATEAEKKEAAAMIDKTFSSGTVIYKGYVDDPRNTDNAWMETVAMNFHDHTGESVGKLKLKAGDDAAGVHWQELNSQIELYASHNNMIEKVVQLHNAHW